MPAKLAKGWSPRHARKVDKSVRVFVCVDAFVGLSVLCYAKWSQTLDREKGRGGEVRLGHLFQTRCTILVPAMHQPLENLAASLVV